MKRDRVMAMFLCGLDIILIVLLMIYWLKEGR